MLDICASNHIASDIELIPIQKINEAYERMLKGDDAGASTFTTRVSGEDGAAPRRRHPGMPHHLMNGGGGKNEPV